MTGLYIHIPFCRRRCFYCHFTSGWPWSEGRERDYIDALLKEASLYHARYGKQTIRTLYLGGGTPSLLSFQGLSCLMREMENYFLLDLEEATLEVNPEDVSAASVALWKSVGFNRISLGLQSLQPDILHFLSRPIVNVEEMYDTIRVADFHRLSVDFIVGLPGLDSEKLLMWIENHCPDHLSLYMLSIEQGSTMAGLSMLGKIPPIDSDMQAMQYLDLGVALSRQYKWYEISNFARDGSCRALHNSLYWSYEPYFGLGIGASGFLTWEKRRYKNTIHWHEYRNKVESLHFPWTEVEQIDDTTERFEKIMLALRTTGGLDMQWVATWATQEAINHLREKVATLSAYCWFSDGRLILSPRGRLVANAIITEVWNLLTQVEHFCPKTPPKLVKNDA